MRSWFQILVWHKIMISDPSMTGDCELLSLYGRRSLVQILEWQDNLLQSYTHLIFFSSSHTTTSFSLRKPSPSQDWRAVYIMKPVLLAHSQCWVQFTWSPDCIRCTLIVWGEEVTTVGVTASLAHVCSRRTLWASGVIDSLVSSTSLTLHYVICSLVNALLSLKTFLLIFVVL